MKEIIIYGAGSYARMMRLYIDRVAGQKVVAVCVDQAFMGDIKCFDDLPLVPFEEVEAIYPAENYFMFVAVGYSSMRAREVMYNKAKKKGYNFISYIDSSVLVDSTSVLGENNVVLSGSIIEPFSSLGDNNILWSSVIISHDVKVGSHCFFASQTLLGGNCIVDDGCFFGFNSTCVQNAVIGKESLIGAKSLVLSKTERYSKNIGVPAKKILFHRDEGILIK